MTKTIIYYIISLGTNVRIGGILMKFTHDFLFQKYVLENRTVADIAKELGINKSYLKAKLRRLGIRKIPFKLGTEIYDNREWLYEQYILLGKGYTVIAIELGVSYTTILDRIIFFGWDVRGHKDIDKASPRKGKRHTSSSLLKIKASRVQNRKTKICNYCSNSFVRVLSLADRSRYSYCSNECFRKYLKENRVIPSKVTFSAEYKEWRLKVYKRDGFRCKMPGCISKTRDIAAHHIYPKKLFPEKQFDVQNGITLCRKCHEKTYGKEDQFIGMLVRVVQKMNG
jgi:5-methylcytosine-specific restriction endonuclease McrA